MIVTSYLFDTNGLFLEDRLSALVAEAGRECLVIDLSCRRQAEGGWRVAMNRWQTPTDLDLSPQSLSWLAGHCSEFLVHAVDVEGKCEGIDEEMVAFLGRHSPIPATYAGGIHRMDDLYRIDELSDGRLDATVGSALDLFGGRQVRYRDCLEFNRRTGAPAPEADGRDLF